MRKRSRINWFILVIFPILATVPLAMSQAVNAAGGKASMNPFFIITGAFSATIAFNALIYYLAVHGSLLQVNAFAACLSNRQRTYSNLGVLAGFLAFTTGFMVLIVGGADPIERPLMQAPFAASLFWINLLLTAYFLYCFVRFWTHYRVRESWLTVYDGKIFYPGEDVTFYPWNTYEIYSIDAYQPLGWNEEKFQCHDGLFNLGVVAPITIDITETQRLGTTHFDHSTFVKHLKIWFVDLLHRRSKEMSLRDFLTTKQNGAHNIIDGISVSWDGTTVLTHKP